VTVHADPFGFPAASEGLVIHFPADEEGPSLEVVARTYGDLTSQSVIYTDETRTFLSSVRLSMNGPLEIPADRVQATIEALLASYDFMLVPLTSAAPRLVEIVSMRTGARSSIRQHAVFVDAEHLDLAAEHPAVLCTTVLNLPHTDVRQLSNSIRALITDPNTQQMVPAGNSNTLILVATGAELARLARMLQAVDDASASAPQVQEQGPSRSGGAR
ncbi:MAG: hypothetical protein O2816_06880, partial [Planctomycetota bacterium]|nr:hypothetical protein [Planctomycetota bacterium]